MQPLNERELLRKAVANLEGQYATLSGELVRVRKEKSAIDYKYNRLIEKQTALTLIFAILSIALGINWIFF